MTDGPQEKSHTNRNGKRYKWPMFNFLRKAAQSNVSKFRCLIAEVHCFIAHGTGAGIKLSAPGPMPKCPVLPDTS